MTGLFINRVYFIHSGRDRAETRDTESSYLRFK